MTATSKFSKVAALRKIMLICNDHGALYNPGNAALRPAALAALVELANEKNDAVIEMHTTYTLAVNVRQETFSEIPKLAVRITRMVAATNVSDAVLEDVKMIRRRFFQPRGKKAKAVSRDGLTEGSASKSKGLSRLDRISLMDSFAMLLILIERIPEYQSNDAEFKVAYLKEKLEELRAVHLAVMQAKARLQAARSERDKIIEGPGGVVETTQRVKDYIRAKFGFFSYQAKMTRPTDI
jgi:hypothetical protein